MMRICMPRGDIRDVCFTVYDSTGQEVSDVDFDEIYVTCKADIKTNAYLFQKKLTDNTIEKIETGVYQFRIEAADTDGLKFGQYPFDIELMSGTDIKQTTVGVLELTPEVTYYDNE